MLNLSVEDTPFSARASRLVDGFKAKVLKLELENLPILHLIADVEDVVGSVEDVDAIEPLRADLVNILVNANRDSRPCDPFERVLKQWASETAHFIKEHDKEIVIVRSDKGNRTVVMNRSEYLEKMRSLVQDESTYREIPKDPTSGLQRKNNLLGKILPEGHILASLDVVSLFTNVPIGMLRVEVERRYVEIEESTTLEKSDVMKILDFCIDAGYFVFDGRIFRQLDGVAMGSPLGPIAADIIMQKRAVSEIETKGSTWSCTSCKRQSYGRKSMTIRSKSTSDAGPKDAGLIVNELKGNF
uniref:Reverse transcriptase domain-containing protein n=1 Tax=Lutzomyia longipalpis TaxID=7200 RepID=A0A1B0CQX4_LUTLO